MKVKYIGSDMAEIYNGEIYEAFDIKDDDRFYGVIDRSGEAYAYPKNLFIVMSESEDLNQDGWFVHI